MYFGLGSLGINIPAMGSILVALTVNSSAYLAEVVRSGIQAIPAGHIQTAMSLGMTVPQIYRHIIPPQAFKIVVSEHT